MNSTVGFFFSLPEHTVDPFLYFRIIMHLSLHISKTLYNISYLENTYTYIYLLHNI